VRSSWQVVGRRIRNGRDLKPTLIYSAADARQFLGEARLSDDATIAQIDGRIMSVVVRASKPAAAEKRCCGPHLLFVIMTSSKIVQRGLDARNSLKANRLRYRSKTTPVND